MLKKNASDEGKEKSKHAKVLYHCLSMLFDFGTAHIMLWFPIAKLKKNASDSDKDEKKEKGKPANKRIASSPKDSSASPKVC